ncbi:uncharacterized protein LOC114912309 [Scleropages formosus]|uniref:uncharacterized protein LOC114912309 n=1 Tax=Scleropages formosus TaxID=113540 RepID=UPI0010FA94F9|nr:uncharacterized protein LOC114912309 [Scleropages formosus]
MYGANSTSGKASEAAATIADCVRKAQQTYPDVRAIVLGDLNQCKLERIKVYPKKKTRAIKGINHAMNRRRQAFNSKDWDAVKLAGKDLREKLKEAKHERRKHLGQKDAFETNNPGTFRDIMENMAGTSSSRKPSSSEDGVEFSDSLNRYFTGFELQCNSEKCKDILKGTNRADPGVYNCSSRRCDCCRYMKANIKQFESTGTKKSYSIREVLSCDTKSVIYVIECQKCREKFVEKTVGPLKKRFSTVKNSVLKKQYRPVSRHFNSDGHSLDDLRIFPIEQVSDIEKLKERAEYWHEELVLLDVEVDELQYECEAMEEQGRVPGEPVQPSRASAGDSSTSVAPKRRNEEEGGVSPAKKRRKKKKTTFFSRETEQLLSACR